MIPTASAQPIRMSKVRSALLSLAVVCVLATTVALGCHSKAKPQMATTPLDAERLRVYSDFLDTFSALHFKRLANQTAPFAPSDLPQGSPCVDGVELEDQSDARKVLHRFGEEIIGGRDLILVNADKQTRLLVQKESD